MYHTRPPPLNLFRCALPVSARGLGLDPHTIVDMAFFQPLRLFGIDPHTIVDMAFFQPLRLFGIEPHTVEDAWANQRRRRSRMAFSRPSGGEGTPLSSSSSSEMPPSPPPPSSPGDAAGAEVVGSSEGPESPYPTMAVAWDSAKGAFGVVARGG